MPGPRGGRLVMEGMAEPLFAGDDLGADQFDDGEGMDDDEDDGFR